MEKKFVEFFRRYKNEDCHTIHVAAGKRAWQPVLSAVRKERGNQTLLLQSVLARDDWKLFLLELGMYLRIELPHHMRSYHPHTSFSRFAQKRIRKSVNAVVNYPHYTEYTSTVKMHALRKRFRKARYIAEALVPADRKSYGKLAHVLKKCVTTLGVIHDGDMLIDYCMSSGKRIPATMRKAVEAKRAAELQNFIRQSKSFLTNRFVVSNTHPNKA